MNGKLLIIGGSHLFHAASLWSLKIASRIVDMIFYSSVPENNEIVEKCKEEFRDGIIVPRNDLEHYIKEADCILIGPGMVRRENNDELRITNYELNEINQLSNEGDQTYYLTKYILTNYPDKKFVLDAGAIQELKLEWLENLKETPILTPHHQELEMLAKNNNISTNDLIRRDRPPGLSAIILLKGQIDTIYSQNSEPIEIEGGVPGMTKGGTGDVLAGLLAALYTKNNAITSTVAASFFNKKAGEELFKTVGNNFNSSDLVDQLPKTMYSYISRSHS
jgi:hydroxyethylthiazole kinase-like uncharacterized protein yjeF